MKAILLMGPAACALFPTCAQAATPPSLQLLDQTAVEGRDLVLQFNRVGTKSAEPSTATCSTVAGTAKPGIDYVALSNVLVRWDAANAASSITVQTIGNTKVDGTRTLMVKCAKGTNARLLDGTATAIITDDDVAPPVVVTPDPTSQQPSVPPAETSIGPVGEKPFNFLGVATVPSEFDPATSLHPTCDYTGGALGCLAGSNAGEGVGAFRFMCNAGQLLRDDPVVFPGQPGKSHLHQFYGLLSANGNSTYESLRQGKGPSSCESPAGDHPVNRSAYWMPAMLDGVGNVVRPDYISIYYKRAPLSSTDCNAAPIGDPSRGIGDCRPLANGLRMIAGYDMVNSKADTSAYFNCDGPAAQPGHYPTITEAAQHCPTSQNPDGSYNRLGAVISMPDCWDGRLDSPDHRSHMAHGSYGWWGYYRCADDHPYLIPTFTMGVWYTVDANLKTWHLSSDEMHPELPAGSTFHADWFGAWDNKIEAVWMDHCINGYLNCAGGDLGNGTGLWQAGIWKAEPRLVPLATAP